MVGLGRFSSLAAQFPWHGHAEGLRPDVDVVCGARSQEDGMKKTIFGAGLAVAIATVVRAGR